jgi:hypothetical protein
LSKFWKRPRSSSLDGPAYHPRPRPEFRRDLATGVHQSRPSSLGRLRIAYAVGLTTVLVVAAGSFGGFGYAATGTEHAAKAAAKVFNAQQHPSKARSARYGVLSDNPSNNEYAGQRCTMYHLLGNGRYIIIEVAGESVPAHLAHGDILIECHPR